MRDSNSTARRSLVLAAGFAAVAIGVAIVGLPPQWFPLSRDTITGLGLIVPLVAASFVVIVHRQRLGHERLLAEDRLRHERLLADKAELRRVLDAGAELLARAERNSQHLSMLTPGPGREEASQYLELLSYGQRLLLWVEPRDDLVAEWIRFLAAYRAVEGAEHPGDGWDRLGSSGAAWMKVARARVAVKVPHAL